jgi:hypothetical protein
MFRDLHFVRIALAPDKTDSILIVDSNSVLSGSILLQGFEPIARNGAKIVQAGRRVQ